MQANTNIHKEEQVHVTIQNEIDAKESVFNLLVTVMRNCASVNGVAVHNISSVFSNVRHRVLLSHIGSCWGNTLTLLF